MSTSLLEKTKKRAPSVGMSQIAFLSGPDQAMAILGSCIGLAIYHPRLGVGALAHIVLSKSDGRNAPVGMFADTAIPHMIDQLKKERAGASGLIAKFTGGASMFDSSGPIQVGKSNAEVVRKILSDYHISIEGEHVGGTKGRRITLDVSTGELKIEVVGQPTVVL